MLFFFNKEKQNHLNRIENEKSLNHKPKSKWNGPNQMKSKFVHFTRLLYWFIIYIFQQLKLSIDIEDLDN